MSTLIAYESGYKEGQSGTDSTETTLTESSTKKLCRVSQAAQGRKQQLFFPVHERKITCNRIIMFRVEVGWSASGMKCQ